MTAAHVMYWALGTGGGASAPFPEFSSSVNPYVNAGADYAHHIRVKKI